MFAVYKYPVYGIVTAAGVKRVGNGIGYGVGK